MRSPIQVAASWLKKAETEKDDFDKFISLWFAFNALYNQFFHHSEIDAIYNLIFSHDKKIEYTELRDILTLNSSTFFENRIIRDCRGNGKDTIEYAAKLKDNSNSLRYRLFYLLKILYQVRCNLFHGNKMFDSDSDQEIIKNAASSMELIIRALIS